MPELPEVENVKLKLEKFIVNEEITSVSVLYERMIRNTDKKTFIDYLIGNKFISIDRKGKHLIFKVGNKEIVSHLRMEGKFNYVKKEEPLNKHDHVIFHLKNGYDLRYNDVRKFGTMDLVNKSNEVNSVKELGPEPNTKELNKIYLAKSLFSKKTNIKNALLDQTVIAGLGNIYVDEVLFDSKIKPTRIANSLNEKEISRIIKSTNKIIANAISQGGSSVRTYNSLGTKGNMQNFHKVYGRANKECFNCKEKISKIKISGRGTHFCDKCQL